MKIKEEIQKEIERDKEELTRVVNEFIKATEKMTDLRYYIDYLVGDEIDLNNNIKKNEEKLKMIDKA